MSTNFDKTTLLTTLASLPKKMIHYGNHGAIAHCLLYELSGELCFNLLSIAYFVYNPDFHLCRGIAGIERKEMSTWNNDPWRNSDDFTAYIQKTKFNTDVHATQFYTLGEKKTVEEVIEEIKKSLEKTTISSYSWQIKNNNIGILLYEEAVEETTEQRSSIDNEHLDHATGILSFCTIEN